MSKKKILYNPTVLFRRKFTLIRGLLFFLTALNFSCSLSHRDDFVINKNIDSVLTKKIGKELFKTLRIDTDSSFLTDNNKKRSLSDVNNLNGLRNTPMTIFFYLPSKMTKQQYHLLTIEIDEKNEIKRLETFSKELEPYVDKDTITFYSPQYLVEEFKRRYGHITEFDTLENGQVWRVTYSDYGNDKIYFNLSMQGYYRKDTLSNGMVWSDGYYLSYNLLSKSYMGSGEISNGHSLDAMPK